ncbi:nucleoside triphosphate hydrolase [Devosia pacifica]|uniref:Nucleoside triphosphate hydrolase n=1 Tax=Devosia pacifica TaxID=1335967 RepID=A0A918S9F5_9HYPH|nr:nucleoside/nucleotide kinase family protein [Devosia pacifica]GHA31375.1 nucleoside triphosphate hydrolase [Devosia pacifica]
MNEVALTPEQALSRLVAHIMQLASEMDGRVMIGIAGGPGVGKSTMAGGLQTMLNALHPGQAAMVPMDGFHVRHAILEERGHTERKGAPHTFEGEAFYNFLAHLKAARDPVKVPGYSREIEDVVDDAFAVPPEVRIVIVEGNYLLLPDPPFSGIKPLLDYAVYLDVPWDKVEQRLMHRHAEHGLFTDERNRAHINRNDLPNYDLVREHRSRADLIISLITES